MTENRPEQSDICIDLSKFRKKQSNKTSKTFLCWPHGTEGFQLVNELRDKLKSESIDAKAEDVVVQLLKRARIE